MKCAKKSTKYFKEIHNPTIDLIAMASAGTMHRAEYVPNQKGGQHLKDKNDMIYALNKWRDKKT